MITRCELIFEGGDTRFVGSKIGEVTVNLSANINDNPVVFEDFEGKRVDLHCDLYDSITRVEAKEGDADDYSDSDEDEDQLDKGAESDSSCDSIPLKIITPPKSIKSKSLVALSRVYACSIPDNYWGRLVGYGIPPNSTEPVKLVDLVIYPDEWRDEYIIRALVDERRFSVKFHVEDRETGEEHIIKLDHQYRILKQSGESKANDNQVMIELEALSRLQELASDDSNRKKIPNPSEKYYLGATFNYGTSKLHALFYSTQKLPTAKEYFRNRADINCTQYVEYAKQLLHALVKFHAAKIIYNNLRPDNILMDGDKMLLSDFDNACLFEKQSNCYGKFSPGYSHPVILTSYPLSDGVDMFSFGLTMLELFYQGPAFSDFDQDAYFQVLLHLLGKPEQSEFKEKYLDVDRASIFYSGPVEMLLEGKLGKACPHLKRIIVTCFNWDISKIPSARSLARWILFDDSRFY